MFVILKVKKKDFSGIIFFLAQVSKKYDLSVKLSKVHTGGEETRKRKVKATLNIMLTLNVIPF